MWHRYIYSTFSTCYSTFIDVKVLLKLLLGHELIKWGEDEIYPKIIRYRYSFFIERVKK